MKDKDTRGRKMKSDNVRVVPEFREQVDIEKLCQALIEIVKNRPLLHPTSQHKHNSSDSRSGTNHIAYRPGWFLARIWYTDSSPLQAVEP